MKEQSVCIGIDGGATKTVCAVVDLKSESIVASAACGSCNRNSVGQEAALSNLVTAIDDSLAAAHRSWTDIQTICAGISGIDTQDDLGEHQQLLRTAFNRRLLPPQAPIHLCNDAVAALAAGTSGSPTGIVLVAGTGMIALGACDGRTVRAGGWGPLFRDGGCGYDISQRAIVAAAKAADGRGPPTQLVSAIPQSLNVSGMRNVMRWLYEDASWSRVASLAPVVVACAANGDAEACRILSEGAAELTQAVQAVSGRLDAGDVDLPIILAGGLMCDDTVYSDLVARRLRVQFPGRTVTRTGSDAADGAALLALHYHKAGYCEGDMRVLRGTMHGDAAHGTQQVAGRCRGATDGTGVWHGLQIVLPNGEQGAPEAFGGARVRSPS